MTEEKALPICVTVVFVMAFGCIATVVICDHRKQVEAIRAGLVQDTVPGCRSPVWVAKTEE